jgi:hypothetical protein
MPPMPGRGVRTVASDCQFLHFAVPGQQLTHSLPALRHSQRVWVALEQLANLVRLQHVAGSLDVERRWRWRELGLREVSVGAIVSCRLNNSVDIKRKKKCSVGIPP